VKSGDGALRIEPIHPIEPGEDVDAEAKQARDITQDQLQKKDEVRRHLELLSEGMMLFIP
jgi:hypothetical protein